MEAVKAPPVPGMQKPSARVGKRFQDHFVEAPRKKAKKPAVCKRDPLGCGRTARVRTRLTAAATRAARRGICCRAGLKVADSDDLVPCPVKKWGPWRRTA